MFVGAPPDSIRLDPNRGSGRSVTEEWLGVWNINVYITVVTKFVKLILCLSLWRLSLWYSALLSFYFGYWIYFLMWWSFEKKHVLFSSHFISFKCSDEPGAGNEQKSSWIKRCQIVAEGLRHLFASVWSLHKHRTFSASIYSHVNKKYGNNFKHLLLGNYETYM